MKNLESIHFNYDLKPRFAPINYLANSYTLQNFNNVLVGDPNIDNSLSHNVSMNYHKYKSYRGYSIYLSLFYVNKVRQFQPATKQIGLNRVQSYEVNELPNQSYGFSGSYRKQIFNINYRLKTRLSINDYSQRLNLKIQNNKSKNTQITFIAKSNFDRMYPNFILSHSQRFSDFSSSQTETFFVNKATEFSIEYEFLTVFEFNAKYSFSDVSNTDNSVQDKFNELNFNLVYQRENSRWTFELNANNLLNNKVRSFTSFSDFVVSNRRTYIMPRVVLLKVIYKL